MAQAESAELPYNPVSFTLYDRNDLSIILLLCPHIHYSGNAFGRWSPSKCIHCTMCRYTIGSCCGHA